MYLAHNVTPPKLNPKALQPARTAVKLALLTTFCKIHPVYLPAATAISATQMITLAPHATPPAQLAPPPQH